MKTLCKNKLCLAKGSSRLSLLLWALFLPQGTPAQLSGSSSQKASSPSQGPNKLSFQANLTWGNSLKDADRDDFSSDASLGLLSLYQVSQRTTAKLNIAAQKNLTKDLEGATVSPVFLGLHRKISVWGPGKRPSLSTEVRIYLPMDEEKRRQSSYRGTLYFRPTLSFDLTPYLKYSFRPSYSENIHQFKTFNEKVNTQRVLSVTSSLQIQMTEKSTLYTLFGLNQAWNYRGSRRETYLLDISLGISLSNKGNLTLGYGVEATSQTPAGKNNIRPYDNERGSTYVSFAYLL